jgi:hypothetical protein
LTLHGGKENGHGDRHIRVEWDMYDGVQFGCHQGEDDAPSTPPCVSHVRWSWETTSICASSPRIQGPKLAKMTSSSGRSKEVRVAIELDQGGGNELPRWDRTDLTSSRL